MGSISGDQPRIRGGGGARAGAPLGVVVVHFACSSRTWATVESVLADPSAVDRRVAVVDNAGDVDVSAAPAGVIVVPSGDNPGYGAALNRGVASLEEADGCLGHVCLNNDVLLEPGFLDAARDALEAGAGAAGGPIYRDPDHARIWYAGGDINFALGIVRHNRTPEAARRPRPVTFIPATAIAVHAAAWGMIGGFDERFFLYNEDVDLCLRLRRAGWELRFIPEMAAVHLLGAATGSEGRSPLYLEHLTRSRLLPFHPRPYRLYLAVVHSGWVAVRAIRGFARYGGPGGMERARALVRGHLHALRTLFEP
jgi:N-acetylglucosaminyl-diphospho-decaprenol L-rhamnosyltransferase